MKSKEMENEMKTAEIMVDGVKTVAELQGYFVWRVGATEKVWFDEWVSPQCAECGEVETADTLELLTDRLENHECYFC